MLTPRCARQCGRPCGSEEAAIGEKMRKKSAAALSRIGYYGVQSVGDSFEVDFTRKGVAALIDLDQKRLGRALAALAKSTDDVRQALIYYAGHGIEIDGQNYLIPIDAKLAHV